LPLVLNRILQVINKFSPIKIKLISQLMMISGLLYHLEQSPARHSDDDHNETDDNIRFRSQRWTRLDKSSTQVKRKINQRRHHKQELTADVLITSQQEPIDKCSLYLSHTYLFLLLFF
jgi:hypothetical protein